MPIAGPTAALINPSAVNPPVALTTGVVQNGNGIGGQFILSCGAEAYNEASLTTVVTGSPVSLVAQLQGSMDGTNWVVLATSTSTTGETVHTASGAVVQFSLLRVNISVASGGTNPTIQVAVSAFASTQGPLTVTQGTGATNVTPWLVAEGSVNALTTLTAAQTATVTGTVLDAGTASQGVTYELVTSGTVTAGAVTFLGSIDNTTFVPLAGAAILGSTGSPTISNGVLSMTAASTALVTLGSNNVAIRYFRADLTTSITGGGSVTVKVAAF